jgi:hypothetical protein
LQTEARTWQKNGLLGDQTYRVPAAQEVTRARLKH